MRRILKKLLYVLLTIILIFSLSLTLFVNFHPVFGDSPSDETVSRMMQTPNYIDGRFTNLNSIKETFGWSDYKKMFAKRFRGNPKGLCR